jgi:hypothetical protein
VGVADMIERSRGGPLNYEFAFMSQRDAPAQLPSRRGGKKAGANLGDGTPPTLRPGATTLDPILFS